MAALRYDRLLCIDLELTCWEEHPPAGQRREIIEIGIVEADPRNLEIVREDRYLVRPASSEVSPFCTALTGLTAGELRRHGRPLLEVMRTVVATYGPGGSDPCMGRRLVGDRARLRGCGIPNPFPGPASINLGQVYMLLTGATQRPSVSRALQELGLEFDGRPHGALVDARNTIAIYRELATRFRAPAPNPRALSLWCPDADLPDLRPASRAANTYRYRRSPPISTSWCLPETDTKASRPERSRSLPSWLAVGRQ